MIYDRHTKSLCVSLSPHMCVFLCSIVLFFVPSLLSPHSSVLHSVSSLSGPYDCFFTFSIFFPLSHPPWSTSLSSSLCVSPIYISVYSSLDSCFSFSLCESPGHSLSLVHPLSFSLGVLCVFHYMSVIHTVSCLVFLISQFPLPAVLPHSPVLPKTSSRCHLKLILIKSLQFCLKNVSVLIYTNEGLKFDLEELFSLKTLYA